jgi:flagellin-like protein
MHKQSKSKKGITPILATLLLIVIAVAAIVVTYAWIMTYMTKAGTQAGVRLTPANINFYGTAHDKIDIDIQDTGTSDAHIIQIYIGTSSSTLENYTSASLPTVCLAGAQPARITVNYNWTLGATYYFKVIASEQILGPWGEQAPAS